MPLALLGLLAGRGRTFPEICTALGTDARHVVSYYLARLRRDELIECRVGGPASLYEVTEAGRRLAETIRSFRE